MYITAREINAHVRPGPDSSTTARNATIQYFQYQSDPIPKILRILFRILGFYLL